MARGGAAVSAETLAVAPAGTVRWLALVGALFTQAISLGATFSAFGFLLVPIAKDFGADVSIVNLGLLFFMPAQAVFGLALGPLVDRFGPRIAMLSGAAASLLGCLLIWQAHSLLVAGAGFVLVLAPASGALGALPASKLVSDWFPDMRGAALGICGIGPSIGALAAPYLVATAETHWGWRGAVLACGVAFAALLPLVALLVQEADGSRATGGAGTRSPRAVSFLRDSNFWVITACFGLCFGLMLSLGNAYPAYGTETRGITAQYVGLLLGASAVVGIAANLGFGWLADRYPRKPLIWAAQLPLAVSVGALALTPPVESLLPLAVAGGIAQGLTALWTASIGDRFEPGVFGSVMGAMGFCMLPITMSLLQMPIVVFEETGRFELAFAVYTALLALAALAIAFLRAKRASA
jgi:MFS family permease